MSASTEIDGVILDILLKSEHGREWLESAAASEVIEKRLLALRRLGLDPQLVAELWTLGDADLVEQLFTAAPGQIPAVNQAYRERARA